MKEEETLLPYTVEELLERAEEGRRQIALGNYTEVKNFLRELDKDFEEEANKSSFTAAEELHYEAL